MKTSTIATIATIGFLIFVCAASYISAYNYGNMMEKQLEAKYSNMEVILASASSKVADLAKVPTMYKNDAVELIKAEMQGRYGENGSTATFQFFKEKGIQLDADLYRRIQQEIVAGRDAFTGSQKEMITVKQQYETQLGTFWKGLWLNFAGYPKIDLSKFKIISSNHAQEAFRTGVDNGFKF